MRIKIKNFKQHSDRETVLPDKGLILLKGPTGSGKSTIFEAVYDAVTGEVDGVTPWTGEKPTENVLEFNDLAIVRSHCPESLAIQGGVGSVAQAAIYSKFGMNSQEFLASSYIQQKGEGTLLLMQPAEQLRFIQRLAFGDQDPEVVRKRITDMIAGRKAQIDAAETSVVLRRGLAVDYANKLNALEKERPEQPQPPFSKSTLAEIEDRLKGLNETKDDRRIRLNENVKLANDKGHEALRRYDTVAGIINKLRSDTKCLIDESETKLSDIPRPWAELSEENANKAIQTCVAKTAYLEWKDAINAFVAQLKGKFPDFSGPATAYLENKLLELESQRALLGRRIIELTERITSTKNSMRCHKCPECGAKLAVDGQKLILATDRAEADVIEKQVIELEATKHITEVEEVSIRNLLTDIKIDLKLARTLKEKAKPDPSPGLVTLDDVAAKTAELTAYKTSQIKIAAERSQIANETARASSRLCDEEARFAALTAEVESARKRLPKQEAIQATISELNNEIATLETEITGLGGRMLGWNKYENAQLAFDRYSKELARAQEEVTKSESAVAAQQLVVDGAKERWASACRLKELSDAAAVAATESIIATINEHARTYIEKMFPDGGTSIRILSGFKTKTGEDRAKLSLEVIHRNKKAGKSIRALSGGEKDRAILAFQLAMSTMYQSPILMIDEGFTGVDGENLKLCLEVLKEISATKLVLVIEHGTPEGLFDQVVEIAN